MLAALIHRILPFLVIFMGLIVQTSTSFARVEAQIDIKSQRMVVKVDGEVAHVWKVSTARRGYVTPKGSYSPKRLHKKYYSRKYDNAPMPYSIFFKGGYAVHGTGRSRRSACQPRMGVSGWLPAMPARCSISFARSGLPRRGSSSHSGYFRRFLLAVSPGGFSRPAPFQSGALG